MNEKAISEELSILRQEYVRVAAEIQARYNQHYHFHYMVLVILGVVSAAYFGLKEPATKSLVFLAGPYLMYPITILMLKEHMYMDLGDLYISSIIKPRAISLLAAIETDESKERILFQWYEFEQSSLRHKKHALLFGFFSLGEYLLPLGFSVVFLTLFRIQVQTPSHLQIIVFWASVGTVVLILGLVVFIRIASNKRLMPK